MRNMMPLINEKYNLTYNLLYIKRNNHVVKWKL